VGPTTDAWDMLSMTLRALWELHLLVRENVGLGATRDAATAPFRGDFWPSCEVLQVMTAGGLVAAKPQMARSR